MKTILMKMIGLYLNTMAYIAPKWTAKRSFDIFCHPIRVKLSEKQLEFLNTATKFTISHKDLDVQCYKWGNGPKNIVLVHGWQSHTFRWKKYVETIDKDKYTVYSLDAPGHGLSTGNYCNVPIYSEFITLLLEQLKHTEAMVAHSIGCFASLYSLYHHPQLQLKRLVLMATPETALEFFDFFQKSLSLSTKTIQLTEMRFKEVFGQTPDYFSIPRFAQNLQTEGLIIHDELDEETPLLNAERLKQAWPTAHLMITKGLGHNLKSTEIVDEVVRFVGGK